MITPLGRPVIAILGMLAVAPLALLAQSTTSGNKPGIRKSGCRKVEGESSIRIAAFDLAGQPAEGLWVYAVSKAYGREQAVQVHADGIEKLWVGRGRAYEVHAHGLEFAGYLTLRDVRVPLNCELQIHVIVHRNTDSPGIIY